MTMTHTCKKFNLHNKTETYHHTKLHKLIPSHKMTIPVSANIIWLILGATDY